MTENVSTNDKIVYTMGFLTGEACSTCTGVCGGGGLSLQKKCSLHQLVRNRASLYTVQYSTECTQTIGTVEHEYWQNVGIAVGYCHVRTIALQAA